MKDGYYLSVYAHIDELAHLRKMFFRHDQNISLWLKTGEDIKLIHYWELERLTGLKYHDVSFYSKEHFMTIMNQLLGDYNISMDDMNEVIGTPLISTCDDYSSEKDYPNMEYHSIAHLFSSLLSNTDLFYNQKIIGLALDGGPDKVLDTNQNKWYYSYSYSDKGVIKEMAHTSSPAPLWASAYSMFGLAEGTLMALVNACKCEARMEPSQPFKIEKMQDIMSDDAELKAYMRNLKRKVWELDLRDKDHMITTYDERFSEDENRISICMKEIHKLSIKMVEQEIDRIIEKHHIQPEECCISLSGGFALNCPINNHIMKKYKFMTFIAPPCVNDGGLSLGYALYYFYQNMKYFNFKLHDAYYGDCYKNIDEVMEEHGFSKFISSVSTEDNNYEKMVEDIIEAPIVWFNGRSEIGPRALGNRSILADPRYDCMKDKLNHIKQRQWWRPVAPIITLDDVDDWFEEAFESPYMLQIFKIKPEKKHLIPAIAHLDDSSRVQTVTEEENPIIYRLLKTFKERTGIPILCNTSLNDRGEPIINTIGEAFNFAIRKKIEVGYINGHRVEFQHVDEYDEIKPLKRKLDFLNYIKSQNEKENMLKHYNPYGATDDLLYAYYFSDLRLNFSLRNKKHVDVMKRVQKRDEKKWYWEIR